jgi:hypothetical protein
MEPMRPAEAQRVTVFGSTLNITATSPGVSNRSGISMVTGYSCFALMTAVSGQISIVPYQPAMSVPAAHVNRAVTRIPTGPNTGVKADARLIYGGT